MRGNWSDETMTHCRRFMWHQFDRASKWSQISWAQIILFLNSVGESHLLWNLSRSYHSWWNQWNSFNLILKLILGNYNIQNQCVQKKEVSKSVCRAPWTSGFWYISSFKHNALHSGAVLFSAVTTGHAIHSEYHHLLHTHYPQPGCCTIFTRWLNQSTRKAGDLFRIKKYTVTAKK